MFNTIIFNNLRNNLFNNKISHRLFFSGSSGNDLPTVAEFIYEKLHHKNVTDVFMYSGGAIMPLIDLFSKEKNIYGINTIISANEVCLASSAVGYAKAHGCNKIGVGIVTSGPGFTLTTTSLLDATNDSTPLLILSGQVPLKAIGTTQMQKDSGVNGNCRGR